MAGQGFMDTLQGWADKVSAFIDQILGGQQTTATTPPQGALYSPGAYNQPQSSGQTYGQAVAGGGQLVWPAMESGLTILGWACIVGGIFPFTMFFWLLIPLGIFLKMKGDKVKESVAQQREQTKAATGSVLMSQANYVGGHPLLPNAGPVVLGLTATEVTIYFVDRLRTIQAMASIPLQDVVHVATGRPKSAHEIYDDDYGHTIDVYEHSPFLSVGFALQGDTYRATFEKFENDTPPHMWANQITTLRYQLKSGYYGYP